MRSPYFYPLKKYLDIPALFGQPVCSMTLIKNRNIERP